MRQGFWPCHFYKFIENLLIFGYNFLIIIIVYIINLHIGGMINND